MFGIQRRLALAVAGSAVALVLAGCSGSDQHEGGTGAAAPEQPAAPQVSAEFNQADVSFAAQMIPHHQQAVDMAALADAKAASPQVKTLATKIRDTQDAEIATLSSMLEVWGQPAPEDPGLDPAAYPGMLPDAEVATLDGLSGAEFDRRFLDLMIQHHRGAITAATTQQGGGKNPQAKELAGRIIAEQQGQITEMEGLKAGA